MTPPPFNLDGAVTSATPPTGGAPSATGAPEDKYNLWQASHYSYELFTSSWCMASGSLEQCNLGYMMSSMPMIRIKHLWCYTSESKTRGMSGEDNWHVSGVVHLVSDSSSGKGLGTSGTFMTSGPAVEYRTWATGDTVQASSTLWHDSYPWNSFEFHDTWTFGNATNQNSALIAKSFWDYLNALHVNGRWLDHNPYWEWYQQPYFQPRRMVLVD